MLIDFSKLSKEEVIRATSISAALSLFGLNQERKYDFSDLLTAAKVIEGHIKG